MTKVTLACDDGGGPGPLVIVLPGAGDVRSENRFLVAELVGAGYRVVNADLPGHGESPTAISYGVEEAASALLTLIDTLGAGPAAVIATSFAPAAAVWAAAMHPAKIAALVAISPHLEADDSLKGRLLSGATSVLMRGRWAAPIWVRLYRGWYRSREPDDLDAELAKLATMLAQPARRRAVRETLTAHRDGVAARIENFARPALVVVGAADDHFPDPGAHAARIATLLGGEALLIDGAGHYPHVERPDIVAPAVIDFLRGVLVPES